MNAPALSRDDIAAARIAEDISAHSYDGRGYLRLYLRDIHRTRVYTVREQRLFPVGDSSLGRFREIDTDTSMYGYGAGASTGWTLDTEPKATAFMSMMHGPVWDTVWTFTRPGDRLTLVWSADNNTEVHDKHGLHADGLNLKIARGDDNPKRFEFMIARSVGPDNSARMIRRYGN